MRVKSHRCELSTDLFDLNSVLRVTIPFSLASLLEEHSSVLGITS